MMIPWFSRDAERRRQQVREAGHSICGRWRAAHSFIEPLESRLLLSETASAQLNLLSTTGTAAHPVFNYDITLTDTGTTNIGTFWFAWIPGDDLLPSAPLSQGNPGGWSNSLTGTSNSADGTAIQWVAQSAGAALTPGQSLSGFTFSSPDSPAALNGNSPTHPTLPVLTAFVYGGAPFSDRGFQFTVTGVTGSKTGSITSLNASAASIHAGDPVTFTAAVAPATPGGPTPTGTVSFFDNGATIGTAALSADGAATFSTSSLPVGTDRITASYSGDGSYSGSTSSPLTETVSPSAINSTALLPGIVKSTLPAAVVGGAPVHGAVLVALTNPSSSPLKGAVVIDLFASADGAIDSSAALVAQLRRNVNLKAGKASIVSVPIRSLPPTLKDGSYTLLARAIAPSSQTADSAAGPTLRVAAPFISLSESFARLTLPATVTGGSRVRAIAALKIVNSGNVIASGPTTIALFLSANGAIDASAAQIASAAKSLHIRPGKSVMISLPLTSVPGVPAGRYFIVAQVIDPDHQTSSIASATAITIS